MEERDRLVVIFVDISEYNFCVGTTDMSDVISRSITTGAVQSSQIDCLSASSGSHSAIDVPLRWNQMTNTGDGRKVNKKYRGIVHCCITYHS